jgi:hypothetical protein
MARKPNYGLNRADVNRSKQAKQEEKQRAKEAAVAERKAAREADLAAGRPVSPENEADAD